MKTRIAAMLLLLAIFACARSAEPLAGEDEIVLDVILYALDDHEHSWPGSPIMPGPLTSQAVNATDIM